MGINIFSRSCCSCGRDAAIYNDGKRKYTRDDLIKDISNSAFGQPDCKKFQILRMYYKSKWSCLEIKYEGATNYEGRKILVYHYEISKIVNAKTLDPHFCDSGHLSPFARFEPTERGWNEAIALVDKMSRKPIKRA